VSTPLALSHGFFLHDACYSYGISTYNLPSTFTLTLHPSHSLVFVPAQTKNVSLIMLAAHLSSYLRVVIEQGKEHDLLTKLVTADELIKLNTKLGGIACM
jgi:hypothetical protein